MHRLIAILLTILFISIGCRDFFTILYFYGNQDYIAEHLCVNKDVPETTCAGKCFLIGQLEESADLEDPSVPLNRFFDHFELKIIPEFVHHHLLLDEKVEFSSNYCYKNVMYPSDYTNRLFHPPDA